MSDFRSVAKLSEIPPGRLKHVELDDGRQICLANIDGTVYAMNGECTHQGGPLGEGELDGTEVICPWHGGMFDITSGKATGEPASGELATYGVRVDGDDVQVAVEE